MKGTHYKVKAAKARENWNRLKESSASETDAITKEEFRSKKLEEQLQKDLTALQEDNTANLSKAQKKDTKLRVAHNKLSNAS